MASLGSGFVFGIWVNVPFILVAAAGTPGAAVPLGGLDSIHCPHPADPTAAPTLTGARRAVAGKAQTPCHGLRRRFALRHRLPDLLRGRL